MISERDLKACLPDVESPMTLQGLVSNVDVFRDPWGIPHIRATCEADLFFAQGFVTAQDRLWHMDYDRFRALGRWAELVGEPGVVQDRLMRAAGMGRTAKLDYEACSAESRSMLDAYAAGVNAFIETTNALPIEYTLLSVSPERWEAWHCITVYKMRNTLLGTFEPKLLRTLLSRNGETARALSRILRGYTKGHLITVPPGAEWDGPILDGIETLLATAEEIDRIREVDTGSNAWSISGELTASGKPLVGGDSHRGLDTPSVYYQAHLACPDFEMIGYTVPGMPGILHFCHNAFVAWGMTYGSADTQDLFIERFRDRSGGREYEFRGKWYAAEVLNETIAVKDGKSVSIEVTVTRHGPVVAGDPADGVGIAISDPGLIEGTPWVDAVRETMLSKSVDDLHRAFGNWTDRVNNYAVADVDGNFGYLHEGKIPIRGEENGWRAVPGWTGAHEWAGYIPQRELPRSINPDSKYAVTCNQRVAGSDYPYYVGLAFTPEFRARLIQERILKLGRGAATADDMGSIHAERRTEPGRILVDRIREIKPASKESRSALSFLSEWDCRMDRDQIAPTIYAETRARLIERVTNGLFGDKADLLLSEAAGADEHVRLIALEVTLGLERDDRSILPAGMTWEAALAEALESAVQHLRASLGDDIMRWKWGKVHRTAPRHPLSDAFPGAANLLDPPSLAVHGDGDTPLAGSFSFEGRFTVRGLSVNRYIHDPSDWRNSRWIVPLGSSGHPGSPHYADQAKLWANVEFIPQLWDWEEIERKAETRQTLAPH